MRRFTRPGVLLRLLIPLILIPLLGIAAKPHILVQKMWAAHRFLESGAAQESPAQVADALVDVAELLPWRADLWEQAGIYAMRGGDVELLAMTGFQSRFFSTNV